MTCIKRMHKNHASRTGSNRRAVFCFTQFLCKWHFRNKSSGPVVAQASNKQKTRKWLGGSQQNLKVWYWRRGWCARHGRRWRRVRWLRPAARVQRPGDSLEEETRAPRERLARNTHRKHLPPALLTSRVRTQPTTPSGVAAAFWCAIPGTRLFTCCCLKYVECRRQQRCHSNVCHWDLHFNWIHCRPPRLPNARTWPDIFQRAALNGWLRNDWRTDGWMWIH